MRYYPMFMDLAGRPCLVVGAGAVAVRKARALLDCGARVTVVGERPAAAFRALERRGVVLERRRFRAADAAKRVLVVAATDDRAVNAAVAAAARRRGIPVNAVDDPPNCDFIVPAVVRKGDLVVAVSTGGKSPAAARIVKERIAALLGDEYAALVKLLGSQRERMKAAVPGQRRRAGAWKRMIDEGALNALRSGDTVGARKVVCRCLDEATGTRTRPLTLPSPSGGEGNGKGGGVAQRGGLRDPTAGRSRGVPKRKDPAACTVMTRKKTSRR